MSAALIAALRESCGYLRDDGYEQTAQLLAMAADEIERLNRRIQLAETGAQPVVPPRHPADQLRQRANSSATAFVLSPISRRQRK